MTKAERKHKIEMLEMAVSDIKKQIAIYNNGINLLDRDVAWLKNAEIAIEKKNKEIQHLRAVQRHIQKFGE